MSKWFYYVLIALGLLVFIFCLIPYFVQTNVLSPEAGVNFYSESWGLLFTLLLFVALFDLREKLEWKDVENKVKRRIGEQLSSIFLDVSVLCKHGALHNAKEKENLLNEFVSQEINLGGVLKNPDAVEHFSRVLEHHASMIEQFEINYERKLSSKIQASLFDISEHVNSLSSELMFLSIDREYGQFQIADLTKIADLIKKIMNDIALLRKNGIDIGF